MKTKYLILCACLAVLPGCGGGGGSSSDSDGELGPQIDGMGRAAINTALVGTFASEEARGQAEDANNLDANPNRAQLTATIADSLAVYDALVGTCGDNPLTNRASANPADGLATGPGRYDFISSVLADDRLYVNSNTAGAAGGQCNQYLAVELGLIGVDGLTADCGGRTPLYDTIATTYSAVAIGAATGVDDGLPIDSTGTASTTVFPFLDTPL